MSIPDQDLQIRQVGSKTTGSGVKLRGRPEQVWGVRIGGGEKGQTLL